VSEDNTASRSIPGDRDTSSVTRSLSVQARVSNILAVGLMSVLGLGSLAWYYANTMTRQDRARQKASAASTSHAQGDTPLPSLGRIVPPALYLTPDTALIGAGESKGESPPPIPQTLNEMPIAPTPAGVAAAPGTVKTPAELALERQLSGAVYAAHGIAGSASGGGSGPGGAVPVPDLGLGRPEGPQDPGQLASLLHPTVTAAVRAQVLPAQRLLLPKGAFIDCTLETAIDSTLPGMTTCVMATDAFGVDGNVVLLERGTKLIGETRGQVAQGSARIFVLWTEARTPAGVVVPLDSPGADELGRSGLPGEVDRHFWQRFGAAMLVSVVDGAVQAATQSARGGSGNVVLNPSSSQDVLTEILKNTINIPPTVVKRNGDRIQVLVARDVDFRSVYELRSTAAKR
jgi:type IV secretion system protein VirB10